MPLHGSSMQGILSVPCFINVPQESQHNEGEVTFLLVPQFSSPENEIMVQALPFPSLSCE